MTTRRDDGVQVELRLTEGPSYHLDFPGESPALRELAEIGSSPTARLVQLPLDGGRAALSFSSRNLIDLRLTPVAAEALAGPHFPDEIAPEAADYVRSRTEPLLERYRLHQPRRQEALTRLCADVPPGPLIVMTFNHGFASLFENWVASCDAHRVEVRDRALVFATDDQAHEFAAARGFRSFLDTESYGDLSRESVEEYGDLQYRELMFVKSAVVQDALRLGRDVLFQDIDMVWLKDPLPALRDGAERAGFDYQFMYDGPNFIYSPTHFNSGFFYVRNSARSRDAWSMIVDRYDRVLWYGSQQIVVNIVMQFFQTRGLRVLRLPEYAYLNGHLLNGAGDPNWSPAIAAKADVVHASWTRNLEAKLVKLRDNGLWYLAT
jgi:hypothetical protein